MTADMTTGARGSPVMLSTTETQPVTTRTAIGWRRRKASAAAPAVIRARLSASGVRSPQLTLSGPCGSTKEPATMQTRTTTARTVSMAEGWAPKTQRALARVLTVFYGSRSTGLP